MKRKKKLSEYTTEEMNNLFTGSYIRRNMPELEIEKKIEEYTRFSAKRSVKK